MPRDMPAESQQSTARLRRGGLSGWVRSHKGPAAAIGGAGVLGAYLLIKHGQGQQAGSGPGGPGSQARIPTVYTGWPGGGPGGGDNNAALLADLAAIERQLARITARSHPGPHRRPPLQTHPRRHRPSRRHPHIRRTRRRLRITRHRR